MGGGQAVRGRGHGRRLAQLTRPGPGRRADKLTLEYTALRVINVENMGARAATGAVAWTCARWTCASSIDSRLGSANKTGQEGAAQRRPQRSPTSCATPPARRASSTTTCCRWTLDGVPRVPAGPARHAGRAVPLPAHAGRRQGEPSTASAAAPGPGGPGDLREQGGARYAARGARRQARAGRAAAPDGGGRWRFLPAPRPARTARPGGLQAFPTSSRPTCPRPSARASPRCCCASSTAACSSWPAVARAGRPEAAGAQARRPAFMTQAVLALSDAAYPAPVALPAQADFTQVQASVFQVARAPGKNLVYLGAPADRGRFCDAVRARAPPVDLAGAHGHDAHAALRG
jgi:cytochrome c biogenesis protein